MTGVSHTAAAARMPARVLRGLKRLSPAHIQGKWRSLGFSSKLAIVLYSLVGACTALLGARVVRTEWFYSGNYEQNYFPGLQPVDALLFLALFAGVFALTCVVLAVYKYLLGRIPLRQTPVSPRVVFGVCWLILFVCWLPYFFVNFPGVIMADSIVTIKQALGINQLTTHHPLAYTGFIAVCLRMGEAIFGGYVPGLAIYTIVQMLFISAVFAYFLSWLAARRIPLPALVVVCSTLALSSIFPLHAASMWKDGIYASFMLLLALRLFEGVEEPLRLARPSFLLRLGLLTLAVCLARTNGVYAMVTVWAALFAVAKPVCIPQDENLLHGVEGHGTTQLLHLRGKVFLSGIASLSVFGLVMGIGIGVLGAESEPVERYGIPIQQTAAVVVFDGVMTEEQQDFMNTLLPLEDYKEEYLPCSVDGIKWADNFNEDFFNTHQVEFLQTWLAMAPANAKIYAHAYIMESYEYWTFGDVRRNVHINYVNDKYDAPDLGIEETNLFEMWFGEGVASLFPFKFITLGEGATSWIVLFAGLMLFIARHERWGARRGAHAAGQVDTNTAALQKSVAYGQKEARLQKSYAAWRSGNTSAEPFARSWWLVLVPAVASWLTVLVSSPFAALPRYVLPSIFLLPFIVLLPWVVESVVETCEDQGKTGFLIDDRVAAR